MTADLTDAERRLWGAFPRGAAVDLGGGDPTSDAATADDWGPDQRVRAEVVAGLLLGLADAEPGRAARLVLTGARITGRLDVSGADVDCGLRLERCWLDEPFEARDAKLWVVSLVGCRVPAFNGMGMQVDGSVALTRSRVGGVEMAHATIAGRLHLTAATLSTVDKYAVLGTRLTVAQGVVFHRVTVTGQVRLVDAQFGGALIFSGARLSNPGGTALDLRGLHTGQSVDFDEGFTADGDVLLSGARVDGQLLVDGEIAGTLDLSRTQAHTVRVEDVGAARVQMDGLTYTDLKPDAAADYWLERLRHDPDGYRAQPYEHLAGHYRRLGQDEQARRVLLAKRRAHRATRPPWRRVWGWAMDGLAGYGYAPGRALGWLAAGWLAGWWYFAAVARPHPPHAGLYALDVLVPTSPFGLADKYADQYTVDGAGLWVAIGLQIMGWALSLAVLPAVARAFNRS